jgi:integrase/recombinase XerD
VRRAELLQVQTSDLSADLIQRPFLRVVPLKDARDSGEGRIVALSPSTVRAVVAYLRVRRTHRRAEDRALWLGTRNRGPLKESRLGRMLKRRAEEAGYDPDVHPHQFRHTFASSLPVWREAGPRAT